MTGDVRRAGRGAPAASDAADHVLRLFWPCVASFLFLDSLTVSVSSSSVP